MFLSKLYIYVPVIFVWLFLFLINNASGLKQGAIIYSFILFLSVASVFLLIKEQIKKHWSFLIQTILFVFSFLLFFGFLTTLLWKYIFVIIFCLGISMHIKYIYIYIHKIRLYPPYILNKIIPALNFLIIYFFVLGIDILFRWSFFMFKSFLGLIFFFILFYWLNYYELKFSFNATSIKRIEKWIEISVISLILTEIYLIIKFFPFSFYFNALIISINYIIIINIWHRKKKLISIK